MSVQPFTSVFEQTFDVMVFGGGYAGYAAAQELSSAGRSVLLVDTNGDLLWESGRCFTPALGDGPALKHPALIELLDDLRTRKGYDGTLIDGGMAEISATCQLVKSDIRTLYYAYPVAVERDGDLIQSVIVATKSGPRRIMARQFIDASEQGLLLKLSGLSTNHRQPERRELYMYLLNQNWPEQTAGSKTLWPNQRLFTSEVTAGIPVHQAIESAIQSLSSVDQQAVLSHVSYEPYPIYQASGNSQKLHGNLAVASPSHVADAVVTLADRYILGLKAARQLLDMPKAQRSDLLAGAPIPAIQTVKKFTSDVLVAGVGTGGVIAAVAAGEQGVRVLAIDPLQWPGGIGTIGGIHAYYYGVPGGMQDQVDTETRDLMKQYGEVLASHSFNPVARMLVLQKHLTRAGVQILSHSMLCSVHVQNGRIAHIIAATEDGPVSIHADVYIDGTGDGDLCALAGAKFFTGREIDGVPHAYSQPTGGVHVREHNIRAGSRNLDSGYCDPSDSEDLTRARIVGVTHYQKDGPTPDDRVTYVAPAIGLRQGRLITTDYAVTLDDQVTGRFCDDVIAYAGSNYDAHTADYPLEADEGIFWVCLSRSWYTGMVTPLPYRSLLPTGLHNVLIASRCMGMTQDAHYGLRMIRCMQRIGEAAGYAAAAFVQGKLNDVRQVSVADLQKKLKSTHALVDDMTQYGAGWYRAACEEMAHRKTNIPLDQDTRVVRAFQNLENGAPDPYFWILMKNRVLFESRVMNILRNSGNAKSHWFAAGIAAMWGSPEAEAVLIDTISKREYGYERRGDPSGPREQYDPLLTARYMQDWLTAVCLLRVCGSDRCLPVLDELLASHNPTMLTAESVLLTLDRLLTSGRIRNTELARKIVSRINPKYVTYTHIIPQTNVSGLADIALRGWNGDQPAPCQGQPGWPFCNTGEDRSWQLTLMLARVCKHLGLDMPADLDQQAQSDRLLARRALEPFRNQVAVK